MQLFDYLANYRLITWLIDLQPVNKHGQSLDSCDDCFLLEANQPVWSVRPLSRNAMTCNLPLQTRKQEPARTWAEVSSQSDHGDFHTSYTSQLLFLISAITKMLVFWDVKKKKLPGLAPHPAADTQSFGGTRSCFSQLHCTCKENSSWVIWPRAVVLSFNVDSVLQCDLKQRAGTVFYWANRWRHRATLTYYWNCCCYCYKNTCYHKKIRFFVFFITHEKISLSSLNKVTIVTLR